MLKLGAGAECRGRVEMAPAKLSMSDLLGDGARQKMINLSNKNGDVEDAMQV